MNEEETGERNCSGKIDKTLEIFSGRGRKRNRGREEGGKVIHDKLCVNFLKHRVVFIAMEEKSAQKMLEASKGSFDFPALEINIRDNLGREFMQKYYTEDFLTKKQVANNGVLPQYYVEGNHEAIIAPETFELVQREIARRREKKGRYSGVDIFGNHLVHALADIFGAFQSYHIVKAAALRNGDVGILDTHELVRDIFHEQQGWRCSRFSVSGRTATHKRFLEPEVAANG